MPTRRKSTTTRWARLLQFAVFGVLIMGPNASALEAQPHQDRTQVRVFAPFTPAGLSAGLNVTERVTGACFTGSLADSGRSDAWRCMSSNRIFDPCFNGYEHARPVLACPDSPWSGHVILLTPTDALPRNQGNKADLAHHLPWYLELGDNVRCQFLTGATADIAGMRINYGCLGGNAFAIGDVDRTLPQWWMFVRSAKDVSAHQVVIKTAWF